MKRVDVLGERPERRAAFSPLLLSEVRDEELEAIVRQAATELGMPIALVSLVLDQVQYFKAHHGLPPDLAASRSTHRDVSFCQFVVRDGLPFEVTDAAADERVPQHFVVEYGIRAYLGFPLHVGDTVIGSLCVLDTKVRQFSKADHESLELLSKKVTLRINTLVGRRRQRRLELADELSHPALKEMQESLEPIFAGVSDSLIALPGLRSVLKQHRHVLLEGHELSREIVKDTLEAAERALIQLEASLHDLDAGGVDCADILTGLQLLTLPSMSAEFSDVIFAAQDLARPSTRRIGGAIFGELPPGLQLATPRAMAVAVLASAISRTADAARQLHLHRGLQLGFELSEMWVEINISCEGLPASAFLALAESLDPGMALDASLDIRSTDHGLVLRLPLLIPDQAS